MHVYYEQNFFRSNSKEELIGFTEFLSNTGGLLGLFLGFSVVSLIEILYFLTFRPYCAQKKQQDNENSLANPPRHPRRKHAIEFEGSVRFRRNELFGQIKRKELALFRPEIFEPVNKSTNINRYQYFEWKRLLRTSRFFVNLIQSFIERFCFVFPVLFAFHWKINLELKEKTISRF